MEKWTRHEVSKPGNIVYYGGAGFSDDLINCGWFEVGHNGIKKVFDSYQDAFNYYHRLGDVSRAFWTHEPTELIDCWTEKFCLELNELIFGAK